MLLPAGNPRYGPLHANFILDQSRLACMQSLSLTDGLAHNEMGSMSYLQMKFSAQGEGIEASGLEVELTRGVG